MPDLGETVGKEIVALIPFFDKVKFQKLKLHAVENAGVWVESQAITAYFLDKIGISMAPKTLIFFLPFHQIAAVLGSIDVPSLSEKGLL